LVEAITNVLLGFGVALVTQIIVFSLFSLEVSLGENLAIDLRDGDPLRTAQHLDQHCLLAAFAWAPVGRT
jgi:hypothetical protein